MFSRIKLLIIETIQNGIVRTMHKNIRIINNSEALLMIKLLNHGAKKPALYS